MKTKRLIMVLLFVAGCTEPTNVLVIPKDKQVGYCLTVSSYTNWAGYKLVTLVDENNNQITCSGEHRLIQEKSFACEDKTYNAQLTCLHGIKINLIYTLKESCKEAYGIAVDQSGYEYEVFMGISDADMKAKIDRYYKTKLQI